MITQREREREVKKLSALASEQLTPELSQGVLVARHVDRPWQVAWVHVAQPELLLHFNLRRGRGREAERRTKRGASCCEQHQPSLGESAWLAPFHHNSTVPSNIAKGR